MSNSTKIQQTKKIFSRNLSKILINWRNLGNAHWRSLFDNAQNRTAGTIYNVQICVVMRLLEMMKLTRMKRKSVSSSQYQANQRFPPINVIHLNLTIWDITHLTKQKQSKKIIFDKETGLQTAPSKKYILQTKSFRVTK